MPSESSEPSLAGRVAIVTGGTSGIGLACVRALSQRGAHVANGSRRGEGEGAMAGALDVTDPSSAADFCARVEHELGPPDILVNAAGVTLHQTVEGHSEEDWQAVIETNLSGPFRMIRAVLPGMKAARKGAIINIASTAARTAAHDYAAYCASKAGLVGLTRAVALEGAPYGVTCTAVSPTWVETEMLRSSAAIMAEASGRKPEEEIAEIAAANPQGRLVQPEEVAALVAFLASGAAPALTMEDIQINAGAAW